MRNYRAVAAFIAAVAFTLGPTAAGAQTLEIVPQIGVTAMQFDGDAVDSGTELGFTAGGKVRIGSGVYVDGGLFWTYQGGVIEVASPINGATSDAFYVRSVRVPVTVGVRLLEARLVNLRLFGGGVANIVAGTGDTDFGFDQDDLKSTNFGLRGGIGVDVLFIGVDLAYEYGISDVFEDSAGLSDVTQRGFVAEAGFRVAI